MRPMLTSLLLLVAPLLSVAAFAGESALSIGGDTYLAGSSPTLTTSAPRDVFVTGFSAEVTAAVAGDLHVAGFDVDASGSIAGNLYAVGADVVVAAVIEQDATIAGFSVRLTEQGVVKGNLRVAAGTATIESPLSASLVATAGELHIDAPINGDALLTAAQISFGPNARIAGQLDYTAPEKIAIPASVISADRVRYAPTPVSDMTDELHQTIEESASAYWPSFFAMTSGFVITLLFLLVIAAIFMAFTPELVARLRNRAQSNLGKGMLLGAVGLSTLTGLIPVSAMTLVGIPLIPFVILAIVLAWTLGYLLGAYALSMRIAEAFWTQPISTAGKLFVLGLGLLVAALLNFIPIAGWLFNLCIVLLGLGAITATSCTRFMTDRSADDRSADYKQPHA